MPEVKTLVSEIRIALDKVIAHVNGPHRSDEYDKAYRDGAQHVIDAIAFELNHQTKASKYPQLALAEAAEGARELGLDVVMGYGRIMISLPVTLSEGDDIIEQSFPRETPILTPVGDTPIGPNDVF